MVLLLLLLLSEVPFPDMTPRKGLAPSFNVWRYPNAYEGPYRCMADCYVPRTDGGLRPEAVRAEDPNAQRCIDKVIEQSGKVCPR